MQGALDVRDHARRDLFETGAAADFLDDPGEDPLRVVALAEEPAVARREPALLPGVQDISSEGEDGVPPAPLAQDLDERLIAVSEDVGDEAEADRGSSERRNPRAAA